MSIHSRILTLAATAAFLLPTSASAQCLQYGDTIYVETGVSSATGPHSGNLSARPHDGVTGDSPNQLAWEQFTILDRDGGTSGGAVVVADDGIVLWSVEHGTKIMAYPPGWFGGSSSNGDVYQTTNRVDDWERWTIRNTSGSCITENTTFNLQSHHGSWLYTGSDGHMRTNTSLFGSSARFRPTFETDNVFTCGQPYYAQAEADTVTDAANLARAQWENGVRSVYGLQWSGWVFAADAGVSCRLGYRFDSTNTPYGFQVCYASGTPCLP